jgi:6-phosphogluconolactonase
MSTTQSKRGTMLYASVGATLTRYELNVENASLTRAEAVALPENVHYAWPHADRQTLYVATSDSASGVRGRAGSNHHVTALAIDAASGRLSEHGTPIALPTRPIHIATDIPSRCLLVAFSHPAGFRVYRIHDDATLGEEISQPVAFDPGIYPHQVRATPDNRHVILVTRGHDATADKAEEPGALKMFPCDDGVLAQPVSIAPNGGYGFGPRHLDFHPTAPFVYVSLERQNALSVFTLRDGVLSDEAVATVSTLADPARTSGRQLAGTVHVHPNGRFVYVANRASATTMLEGKRVFAGGENSFAVYAIDPDSGVPALIQHVDTHGIHCRTFHIDPTGKVLVAAHIMPMLVQADGRIETVPARLCVFRIGPDGRLAFAKSYDVDVGDESMFWMGMVPA